MNNGEKFTFESVCNLLKNYNELQRKAKLLSYELENFKPVADETDLIDAMTFSKAFQDGIRISSTGQTSDKTSNIATSFRDKLDEINIRHRNDLLTELLLIEKDIKRIEYYISLLDGNQSTVLRLLYIEGQTYNEVAEITNLSIKSVNSCRKAGIQELVNMFNLISI